ncbi:hypothetical protein P154DRAFT_183423 [Amniculicola lignicola CBS 123094]|uniref:RNA helicase HEL117 n=1 Tax=Amniculicola lignicola CBS 123094 TaxID=1392246 RepID=A0A6A5X0L9_9PLEO|nr:hypothetical protein P154DRAFT_183423 [Amniculicola lignicola CBS 123094]
MPRPPRSRSRSPMPHRESKHHSDRHPRRVRSRSRSPRAEHSHRHKHHRTRSPKPRAVTLPYNAHRLSKSQLGEYKPLFVSYLDIQKQLNIDELDEREVRGRWKSFVNRWNTGELARSWYDPSMLETAKNTVASFQARSPKPKETSTRTEEAGNASSDDEIGPAPPTDGQAGRTGRFGRSGPTIPRHDDLALRNELRDEDRARDRSEYADDVRHERKVDRKEQKERLEELVPRADPGSRERQLEKRRETTTALQGFRDAKESGDVEVRDADLMGEDDGGIDGLKRRKMEDDRKKSEREIRREEVARAKEAEFEERLRGRREKEAKTMEFLKSLAQERFGA